ncbi:MAG: dUTP diphosphatase [Oscillospiraceae bacterium]
MELKIKRLKSGAVLPKRATAGSAGYDLCACIDKDVQIFPDEIKKIPTGIASGLSDENFVILLYARSGLAANFGLTLANCVGVVDSDYRGEIVVPLINLGKEIITISSGERIAQMVVAPVCLPTISEVDEIPETLRGDGGFGSTGK